MINQQRVEKPQNRSRLRKFLGKESFIIKRKINWLLAGNNFAKSTLQSTTIIHSLSTNLFITPLKDVEMYLQHNKVTTKIAISHIDKVVIQPGQTFSVWQL